MHYIPVMGKPRQRTACGGAPGDSGRSLTFSGLGFLICTPKSSAKLMLWDSDELSLIHLLGDTENDCASAFVRGRHAGLLQPSVGLPLQME